MEHSERGRQWQLTVEEFEERVIATLQPGSCQMRPLAVLAEWECDEPGIIYSAFVQLHLLMCLRCMSSIHLHAWRQQNALLRGSSTLCRYGALALPRLMAMLVW